MDFNWIQISMVVIGGIAMFSCLVALILRYRIAKAIRNLPVLQSYVDASPLGKQYLIWKKITACLIGILCLLSFI